MNFYVLTIQKRQFNKTTKYLDKLKIDYRVLIPDEIEAEVYESYGTKAIVYNTEEYRRYVDFCGTNIKNGAAVGRVASIKEAKKNAGVSVCLDDDYGGICGNKPMNQYKDREKLIALIKALHTLTDVTGIVFGGYSGGAFPNTKNNIMQVWIMDALWSETELNMILNEDVNFSIKKWQQGVANFGMATLLRSNAQTAEMDKIDGNTKHIYQTDRSYRKSFGSVLQDPNNAKLALNMHNTKRGALWHHKVSWSKIMPKLIDKKII